MKSGMTPLFSGDDVKRWFDHFQDRAEEKILKLLMAGGEKFVAIARKSGSYKDQTGNLRSSIGYVIAKDGEVIISNFKESNKGSDKSTGKEKGHRVAEDISLSFSGGYILVGVAGMDYAAAVEAKGYEVVTGANTQCNEYLKKALFSVFKKM
jgi:hypothetical protein bacD2_24105|nr:MAG TPA: hypothetical protein [Caudoviricetes sp.]DAX17305.1 MAG TPA: hypothetical protein [Caudoviricetes sp.]